MARGRDVHFFTLRRATTGLPRVTPAPNRVKHREAATGLPRVIPAPNRVKHRGAASAPPSRPRATVRGLPTVAS
ncbi:MAG: hypothetical protein K0S37_3264 [Microbacterium sp.]|jgi:hypothetical protein|nr:hypothetical protein [Microbacterium sp.]